MLIKAVFNKANLFALKAGLYPINIRKIFSFIAIAVFCFSLSSVSLAVTWPNAPFGVSSSAPPMTLLVSGKDHKLFYEAYNDVSDLDGDGILEIRFTPKIDYYGLFDEKLCYSYNAAKQLFEPSGVAGPERKCGGSRWSGNWLNYATTSRIDGLRKVLYGGYREVDSEIETILRRAYIPQDAHSWVKEYTSEAVDGYKIKDYTAINKPKAGRRHFFGSLTINYDVKCINLEACRSLPPKLTVIESSHIRVWDWASTERPVMDKRNHYGLARKDFTVRVSVCTPTFNDGCKQYPNGNYKPTGLLHDYGEDGLMLFGLLMGSYDKHLSGGRLRKAVSSFADEVDPNTGQFTAASTIVKNFNALTIRNYNNHAGSGGDLLNGYYKNSFDVMQEGVHVDWGNPIGEMMYEGLRYYAGKSAPTASFDIAGDDKYDKEVGLTRAVWDNPYHATSAAKAPRCAKPSMLVISDIYPSFDSDQVPGSAFNSFTGDIAGLNVQSQASTISDNEPNIKGNRFIGQSGSNFDASPSSKSVTSLGKIRGLAPSEPAQEGSYYTSALAYYGKTNDLNTGLQGKQTVESYFLALASSLPNIEFPVNGKMITIVPFGKSVNFTPHRINGVIDTYIDLFSNFPGMPVDTSVNDGRPYTKFRINFEDVDAGGDHDTDAIIEYEILVRADGKVEVNLDKIYNKGRNLQQIGYSIAGSTEDGIYLVVSSHQYPQDAVFFNRPEHRAIDLHEQALPLRDTRIFQPGGASATLLNNPLWYGAKWGGFQDVNNNNIPDLRYEWDQNLDGVPDNYFYVQNALELRESLSKALDNILAQNASVADVVVDGFSIQDNLLVFQSKYETEGWSGEVLAFPFTEGDVSNIPKWRASQNLPAHSARKIFTFTGGDFEPFEWGKLSAADQAAIGDEGILDYLRGDRSNEILNGGTYRTRTKSSLLGDIIHSRLVYRKDTETLYVGANDGMLHAFDAKNGKELFAYVPSVLIPKLEKLSRDNYLHDYYMDGLISIFDEDSRLVATLGRGGKGLFSLDISTPASFDKKDPVWEYFDHTDADLGHMMSKPIVAKMNNDEHVVIVSNGYNSMSGKAVLYIFNLNTGAVIKKIDTLVAGDNGLAEPVIYDEDGDGDVDFIYAGDLKGNLWKFDVTSNKPSGWKTRFGSDAKPIPLFTALDVKGDPQPITATVSIAVNNEKTDLNYKKPYIIFGTGSYFQSRDPLDMNVQTWYGLVDTDTLSAVGAAIAGRDELKKRSISNEGRFAGNPVRTFEVSESGDMAGKRGWYLDFDTRTGERIISAPLFARLPTAVVFLSSLIPTLDICEPGGSGYVNALNPFTGAALNRGIFDIDNDDDFESDKLGDQYVGGVDINIGTPGTPILVGNRLVVGGSIGKIGTIRVNVVSNAITGRILWREIVDD